jgi:serine/threonine-protein kinase
VQSNKAAKTGPAGTPYYMSPEQITGGKLGPWTDIYGLGATLFTLLTGSELFPDGEPLYHAVHTAAPDPRLYVPTLWPGTAALLLSCLEKDPTKRPQSAADLAAGLKSLAQLEPPAGVAKP